jgi:hypothetical protein
VQVPIVVPGVAWLTTSRQGWPGSQSVSAQQYFATSHVGVDRQTGSPGGLGQQATESLLQVVPALQWRIAPSQYG